MVDVCAALTVYPDADAYWRKLQMPTSDSQLQETERANTEEIFRITPSSSSPRAEPFKRPLAKVGLERLLEIEDPENSDNCLSKEFFFHRLLS